jgi:hypothetical protein
VNPVSSVAARSGQRGNDGNSDDVVLDRMLRRTAAYSYTAAAAALLLLLSLLLAVVRSKQLYGCRDACGSTFAADAVQQHAAAVAVLRVALRRSSRCPRLRARAQCAR